jgi:RNA polymerase sigma-70 factor, ECF subfamily
MMNDIQKNKTDEELFMLSMSEPSFFGELMMRYEGKMLLYIKRISAVTNEEAEDILQDSFLKAYRNLQSFDEKLSFSSWLYRIVHNETISYWRKKKIRPHGNSIFVDEEFLERIAGVQDIMIDLDTEDLKSVIHAILEKMDDRYRQILILKFIEDKSYEEIADILKKPLGTVATHINRAKKQFRELYALSEVKL